MQTIGLKVITLAMALAAGTVTVSAGPHFYDLADIPTSRRGAVGGILKATDGATTLSVVGGSNKNAADTLLGGVHENFNPNTNVWTTLAPLLHPRSDHAAASLNGSLYAGGGEVKCFNLPASNICNTTSVERYDLVTNEWTEVAPLLRARRGLFFAADEQNGLLYSVGGMDCKDNCYTTPISYLPNAEVYDLATGLWSELPPMSIGRRDIGAAVVEGKLIVTGGCGGTDDTPYSECTPFADTEIYDPATNEWSIGPSLQQPRHGFALGIHDGTLFAAGGSYGVGIDADSSAASLIKDIEVLAYTGSDSDKWSTLTQMPEPRDGLVKGYGLFIGTAFLLVTGSNSTGAYTATTSAMALFCGSKGGC